MTPLTGLFLLLVALYLSGGAGLVAPGARLLHGHRAGSFRPAALAIRLGSGGRTIQFAPLAPWRLAIQLDAAPDSAGALERSADAVRDRLREVQVAGRPVRIAASTLASFLFAGAPAWLASGDPRRIWPPLLAILGALVLAVAICHHRAHRRLHPEAVSDRWSRTIAMVLLPTDAARAYVWLGRDALSRFDPWTTTAVLGAPEYVTEALERRLRELSWPTADERRSASDAERREQSTWLATLMPEPRRLAEPPPAEPGSVGRCPRCLAPYGRIVESCADCPGVPVLPIATDPTAST